MTKEEILQKCGEEQYGQSHYDGFKTIYNKEQFALKAMDEYAKQREQYWKARCLAAEDYISETPGDPDITNKQILAGEKWQSLKDQEDQFTEQQNKQQ